MVVSVASHITFTYEIVTKCFPHFLHMSKSYGNTIGIFLDAKELKKRVMAIVTDAAPVEAPKDPDKCNLFNIFKLFAPADRAKEVHDLYVNGGASYNFV